MSFWVYKCNSNGDLKGDWDEVFAQNRSTRWGSTEWMRPRDVLEVGDVVIACQTDRNELVGLTEVVRLVRRETWNDVFLRPIEELRMKIRYLKSLDPRIAKMHAFRSGPIKSLTPGIY